MIKRSALTCCRVGIHHPLAGVMGVCGTFQEGNEKLRAPFIGSANQIVIAVILPIIIVSVIVGIVVVIIVVVVVNVLSLVGLSRILCVTSLVTVSLVSLVSITCCCRIRGERRAVLKSPFDTL